MIKSIIYRAFKVFIFIVLFIFVKFNIYGQKKKTDLKLWYDAPAANWNEALPIGNGRLGAMVFGNPTHENELICVPPITLQVLLGTWITSTTSYETIYSQRVVRVVAEAEQVHIDAPGLLAMNTPNVQHEAAVNKHPHVVVSTEFKHASFALHVVKHQRDLCGEKVVVCALHGFLGVVAAEAI